MLRLAEVATACVVLGNSEMTVLSPTLEMSLSRSEDENILEQRELMMTSIWLSFIFLTSGPRLNIIIVGGKAGSKCKVQSLMAR